MTGEPMVSVIMANRNGAGHLAAAVRSVLGQSMDSLELLISDDASTDDSLAVMRQLAAGDPRVRVLAGRAKGGPGAARNRALEVARGRYVAVLDSDDLMAPERLERLVGRARADQADIVVDNLLVFNDDADQPWRPFLNGRAWDQPRWITLAAYIKAGRMYARAPALGYLKPLFTAEVLQGRRYREDLGIGEDYDLVLRLLATGARMRFQPSALYRYRRHSASASHVMRREHIEAMLAADAAVEAALRDHCAEVRRAQARRRRSLQTALALDEAIAALKARNVGGALGVCAADPAVLPLLAIPIRARLRRLMAA